MSAKKVKRTNKKLNTQDLKVSPNKTVALINDINVVLLLVMLASVTLSFSIVTQNIVMIKEFLLFQFTYLATYLFFITVYMRKKLVFEPSPPFPSLILFLLWGVISLCITFFHYTALEEFNRFLVYGLIALLIVQVFTDKKRIKWAVATIVFLVIASVTYVTFQDMDMDFINWGMKVHVSFFGNPNFYSGYLAMTLSIVYSLYVISLTSDWALYLLKTKSTADAILFMVIYVLAFPAGIIYIFMTISARAAGIGTIVALLFFIFWLIKSKEAARVKNVVIYFVKNRAAVLISLGAIALLILAFMTAYITKQSVHDAVESKILRSKMRIASIFQISHGTNKSRLIFYWGAMRMTENMPTYNFGFDDLRANRARGLIKLQRIVGYGIGVFQKAFPFHRPPFYHHWGVSHNTLHTHDEYIELLSEEGIIGLSLFLLFLAAYFRYVTRSIYRIEDRFLKIMQIGVIVGVIGGLGHNLYSVNFRWVSSGTQFWFLIGLSLAIAKVGQKEKRVLFELDANIEKNRDKKFSMGYALLIIAAIAWAFGAVINVERYRSDLNLKRLEIYIDRRLWPQAKQIGRLAVKQNPYSLSAWYKLGYVYLNRGDYKNAYGCYGKILRYAPRYAQIHYNLGLLFQEQRNIYTALDEFKLAARIENNVINYMRIANIYLQLNDFNAASLYFRKAITIPPYSQTRDGQYQLVGYKQLAQVYLMRGEKKKAIDLLKVMAYKRIETQWTLKNLIELLAEQKKYDETLSFLDDLRKFEPNNINIYYSIANINMLKKQYNKAYFNYNKVLRLLNLNPTGEQKDMLAKIIQYYKELYRDNKKNVQLIDLLGVAYWKNGDYAAAKNKFKLALRIKPDYKVAKQHLNLINSMVP